MDSKHRGLGFVVLMFIVSLAGACGDEGVWTDLPGLPTSPVAESTPAPNYQMSEGLAERPRPVATADRSKWISCDMLPEYAVDTSVTSKVSIYVELSPQSSVCFGEPHTSSPAPLCQQVRLFEARAAMISACFARMRNVIESNSKDVLGEHWAASVLPKLPAVWSLTATQVARLSNRVSTGMVEMLAPGQTSAPGSPLCFPTNGLTAELASKVAMDKVQSLVEGTSQDLEEVTSALLRGIDVQVTNDLRLTFAAHFVEKTVTPIQSVECSFELPPAQ